MGEQFVITENTGASF